MTVIAHSGHWLESVVYLVPIVGFALWLAVATIRDRMSGNRKDAAE